jgi:hypothetical protein
MAESDVILMEGAPFSGKTTCAKRPAAQRGSGLVDLDDLGSAVRAVTTPPSPPALHSMIGSPEFCRVGSPVYRASSTSTASQTVRWWCCRAWTRRLVRLSISNCTRLTGTNRANTITAIDVAVGPLFPGTCWLWSRRDSRTCRWITAPSIEAV